MKKTLLLFALFLSVCASVMAQVVVSGDISTNTTWTKNNTYLLTGFVYVTNGAVLTIEPGTVIKGDKNSKGALIVTRGAQLQANGTPTAPIVFTSNELVPSYGDWGGLIILGYAPTNNVYNGTPGLGLIEGGVDPVKGLYGGGDQPGGAKADDNSGTLRYVRVEYPGIAFQPNNEVNGITFGGVGNKTTVEYVQVSYSGDDSFEWFGGTVNGKYLIAYRGLDDDFDTDFGFSGNIQFALSVRDPQVADVSGSNGIESDNNATGTAATPKTRPTFSNLTIVGPAAGPANALYRRGAHLRRNSEHGIYNSLAIGNWPDAGLLIDGDSATNNATNGKLVVRNSFIYGSPTPLKTNVASFDIAAWAVGKNLTASLNSADAQLVDPFNIDQPNPRPLAGSPVLNGANFTSDDRIKNTFFTPVGYAGAFGPSGDWTCPWAAWAKPGCIPNQEVIVSGDITTDTKWTSNNTYILQGFVYVNNCAKLTIEPGTVIKGDKGSKGALIVTRCAQIIADGTPDKPIVFTSAEATPSYGDWGGLILLGYAPTNNVYNGTPGLGLIEGGVDPVKGLYGGGDQAGGAKADDNSGVLRYVRVEYPGIAFQPNNEVNGITFGGVGNKTLVDYVQVSYAGDDSYEWFGGTVNARHLVAYRGLDDDFDTDFGYSGNVQFALSVRDPQVADVSGSNGIESDNNATGTGATPKTRPTFSNVTMVGPNGPANALYRRGAHLRRNGEHGIYNSVTVGTWPDAGLLIDGDSCANNATNGKLVVRNSFFYGSPTPLKTNVAAFNIATWAADKNITTSTNSADAKLTDPFNLNLPNARPVAGSPVLNASNFTVDARIKDAFFTPVSYAGAFGASDDWTCPWTKFPTAGCLPPVAPTVVTVSTDITTDTKWTADKTYILQGFIYVTNCAKLTIEPGTVITGDKGTKGALIITRCAQIIADGTPTKPIVFTSGETTPSYGDWGGLIILGYAPTNNVYNGTQGLGLIEGGVDPVKGLYGGGDQAGGAKADDNSGVLRYVRVEYPGIAFQPNNEVNGITFGGVGNKTLVDYVQVSYAGDDSYEWFGGTVNASHLIAYRGLDDDFDTDFGYNGNVQFAFGVRDPQVADVSGSNGIESDNNATGTGATPKTRPTFSNMTLVGPPATGGNALYRRGAHLRRNSEHGVYNSVTIGNWPDAGLLIDGDSCANNATNGKLVVRNSFIYGSPTPLKTNVAAFNIATWASDKSITTSTNSADAKLTDPFNLNQPNARPVSGSPVLGAANFTTDARIKNAFFVPVSYAGAFSFGDDWTCPWSKFPTPGCLPAVTPTEKIVSSDITTDTKWTADNTYTLQGFIYVTNCAKLTIEPGTIIKGDKGSKGALIVTRCAQIIADGTKDKPIVFTSAEAAPSYGDWGGLIILGYAPTNNVYNGKTCLGLIEGGIDPVKGLYGSGDQPGGCGKADDNSGILRYVRVEYPGIAFQPNNEVNGITFGGVGNKTIVDYVQVSYSGDDSFEWFGGTVNGKHLIAYRGLDDDFDTDFGYSGDIQFALGVRDPQVADVSGSNGFESDNNATGTGATPKTRPTFSNATIVGPPVGTANALYRRGAHLRRATEMSLFNSLIVGNWPDAGILIDGDSCAAGATAGRLEVKNTFVATPVPVKTGVASFNVATWFNTPAFGNSSNVDPVSAKLIDGFNLDLPNAHPAPGSPALLPNAAAFTAARVNKPFFDKVTFAGAFDGTKAGDWTCGWAKFKVLNTACFTGTKDVEKYITDIKLYPTMANDQVTLEINLTNSADLNVEVYGINGQYFGQMVNEKAPAGEQAYRFNVANLAPGFYFVRIQADAAVATEKMIIVR